MKKASNQPAPEPPAETPPEDAQHSIEVDTQDLVTVLQQDNLRLNQELLLQRAAIVGLSRKLSAAEAATPKTDEDGAAE